MEFSGYKLKTKAYLIECEPHAERQRKIKELFPNVDLPTMLSILGLELNVGLKFCDILKQLVTETFHGYATLLFIVEFECFCDMEYLLGLLYEAISSNQRLTYLTKIVITYSFIKLECTQTQLKVTCMEGGKRLSFRLPSEEKIRSRFPELKEEAYEMLRQKPVLIMVKIFAEIYDVRKQFVARLRENMQMRTPTVDNFILIQCKKLGFSRKNTIFLSLWQRVFEHAHNASVQEMVMSVLDHGANGGTCEEVGNFTTTSTGGCYFFNINPALAIVINHLSFIGLEKRNSSRLDIERLRKTFASKLIPQLILSDGSASDVRRIMSKVQHTDFTGVKYLYVIVMSHGDEDDVIYTRDGVYNVRDDIIGPLMANESLKHVQKYVLVNACRGNFDPLLDDETQPLQVTDTDSMDENLGLFFSTQKGCVSLREDDGAIFVKKFCEIFKEFFISREMREIATEVERELLQQWIAFERVTEYCGRPGSPHPITVQLENLRKLERLLEAFQNFAKGRRTTRALAIEDQLVEVSTNGDGS